MIAQVTFADAVLFDLSSLDEGTFKVEYQLNPATVKMVVVQMNDQQAFYSFRNDATYPMVFGNGDYTLSLFEKLEGSQYKALKQTTVTLELNNQESIYLSSNVQLPWTDYKLTSTYAKDLLNDNMTNRQKAETLYDNLVESFSYDYDKATTLDGSYLPNADETLESMNGICIDFATVYAAILREYNIPTKIVKGYKNDIDVYHAWNEVFIEGEWITVDLTYNNAYVKAGYNATFIMDANDYDVKSTY